MLNIETVTIPITNAETIDQLISRNGLKIDELDGEEYAFTVGDLNCHVSNLNLVWKEGQGVPIFPGETAAIKTTIEEWLKTATLSAEAKPKTCRIENAIVDQRHMACYAWHLEFSLGITIDLNAVEKRAEAKNLKPLIVPKNRTREGIMSVEKLFNGWMSAIIKGIDLSLARRDDHESRRYIVRINDASSDIVGYLIDGYKAHTIEKIPDTITINTVSNLNQALNNISQGKQCKSGLNVRAEVLREEAVRLFTKAVCFDASDVQRAIALNSLNSILGIARVI